ncbi:hypothetical protein HNR59_001579 [Aquamicrobium lusatiense]|uniref:Uncharacterized protein n=1 Tax=Aquamicrobium lusatiense TaxID=89772 RepID=A0A7W9S1J9_9HYPH|nr:hypothetical protein [Aquamicrobium lusatiense]MBB6012234.1 hypothetical protein [Aquamicrobium lusatiense]
MIADSPARGLALLYISAIIFGLTYLTVTGDNTLLRPAHIAFALCIVLLTRAHGFVPRALMPIAFSWKGTAVAFFLIYALVMALIHWDREISASFVRNFFDRLLPGILLGYVAFGRYGLESGWLYRRRKFIDFTGLMSFSAVLYYAVYNIYPLMRTDVFLINVSEDEVSYQLYGVYLVIGVIVFLRILEFYWSKSIIKTFFLTMVACFASIVGFLLAQALGSNSAAVLILLINTTALGYQSWYSLRTWDAEGLLRFAIIVAATAGSYFWMINLISGMPPIRLFGFAT